MHEIPNNWPIRKSIRKQNWDYSQSSIYFVTINTKSKIFYFGEINEGQMHQSKIGEIAEKIWNEIPVHFSFIKLDEFVVMPNHIHGIIIINSDVSQTISKNNGVNISTHLKGGITGAKNPMLTNSLSKVLRWYKAKVTFESRKIDINFTWHPRFYDRIIRNNCALINTRNYIIKNPENWGKK